MTPVSSLRDRRERLAEFSGRRVFAEQGDATGFLRTEPLHRLAEDHRTRLPIVIVAGAKGAGKTFAYFQLARTNNWFRFVDLVLRDSRDPLEAQMRPLLRPRALDKGAEQTLTQLDKEHESRTGHLPFAILELQDAIKRRVSLGESSIFEWTNFWMDALAWRMGLKPGQAGAHTGLKEWVRKQNVRAVFLVDGLEDLFQSLRGNESERIALRALLQDVPEQLGRNGEHVGLVTFVRPDFVKVAISQNSQQFMKRYEMYAIRWTQDFALKLALWLAVQARAFATSDVAVADLSESRRDELLVQLWGPKMGSQKSRDARSTPWVLATLADFHNQIQARDIVRFVYHAATRSTQSDRFPDRLLEPAAMRSALKDWGNERVDELSEEDPITRQAFEKLRALRPESKLVPFSRDDKPGLTDDEIANLEENGIILDDNGKLYLTELVRVGLGFAMGTGARPNILSLRRKLPRST